MSLLSHPSASEIVRAVAQWLDEVRPQLDQRNAYLARVAFNALAIVERELAQGANAEANLAPHLKTLLGSEDTTESYDALMRELCERLRSGNVGLETPGLLSLLRDDTLAKLAIDQPSYRHEIQK